jgi:Cu-Zn family superoxide dismutase
LLQLSGPGALGSADRSIDKISQEKSEDTRMAHQVSVAIALVVLALISGACTQTPPEPPQETTQQSSAPAASGAKVELKATQGNNAAGTLELAAMGDGVHFMGTVTGLPAGAHGFHIHENGDCSAPDAASAGGHFNPDGKPHGAPTAAEHHAGDLGNIEADAGGSANVSIHAGGITLEPGQPNSILGKAVIVHAAPDDMTTQPTGNAGARLACGVIQ